MSSAIKVIVACFLLIAVWWSMAELALSSDVIERGVRDVIAHSPFQKNGILEMIEFDTGYCCYEFSTGFAWSVLVTAFSAIPMGLLALALTWRRNSLSQSSAWPAIAQAGVILQGASTVVNLLLAWFWFSDDPFVSPSGWILPAGVIVGFVSVPMWYRLFRALSPSSRLERYVPVGER